RRHAVPDFRAREPARLRTRAPGQCPGKGMGLPWPGGTPSRQPVTTAIRATQHTYMQPREPHMKIDRIHHVAYRCKDAKETVLWYRRMLKMEFVLAFAEDHVPSTHEPDPYMHVFLDAGNGNVLAFFELPTKPEMARDPNTPTWVQHIAFKVKDRDALQEFKAHLEKNGVEAL